jgi:hypothetical protein
VRVVVLVLRQGDLEGIEVGKPVEAAPPLVEPDVPAHAQRRRVQDDRIEAHGSEPARGAVHDVVRQHLGAGHVRQRIDVLLRREPGGAAVRRQVEEQDAPHRERP